MIFINLSNYIKNYNILLFLDQHNHDENLPAFVVMSFDNDEVNTSVPIRLECVPIGRIGIGSVPIRLDMETRHQTH